MMPNAERNNAIGPQVRARAVRDKLIPALVIAIFTLALSAATQFYASSFGHDPHLSGRIGGDTYWPWSILVWAWRWYPVQPAGFVQAGSFGLLVAVAGLLVIGILRMLRSTAIKPNIYLHGSARWANAEDLALAGLLPRAKTRRKRSDPGADLPAVYVGAWKDAKGDIQYLRHSGPEHVLCIAPTRSGKGVGLVLPTLLSWPQSAVITDLKGELWQLTAGWRQQHAMNKVLMFAPAALSGSLCWNPLDEIRLESKYEVGDVQNLATLIVDPDGKGLETHWQKTSQSLLVGLMLHALYRRKIDGTQATLPAIDAMLATQGRAVRDLWHEMTVYPHTAEGPHPVIASAARDMLDRPDDEGGSVLSTAKSHLSLYRDPTVARNISKSEFRIRDLMQHTEPVSLYIVTEPVDKTRLRPLVRVLVNSIVRLNAEGLEFVNGQPVRNYKHPLLMMLDEFPTLGKLEIFQEALAYLAGYGIKCYLICQDLNQLKSRETGYGRDESITSNCHVQIAFPPNRVETAEYLSKMTGQTTVVRERVTKSGSRTAMFQNHVTVASEETQRSLLTVDECLRMPGPEKNADGLITAPGDMLIYATGYPTAYGVQPLYFQDPVFLARAQIAPPKASDRIRALSEQAPGRPAASISLSGAPSDSGARPAAAVRTRVELNEPQLPHATLRP